VLCSPLPEFLCLPLNCFCTFFSSTLYCVCYCLRAVCQRLVQAFSCFRCFRSCHICSCTGWSHELVCAFVKLRCMIRVYQKRLEHKEKAGASYNARAAHWHQWASKYFFTAHATAIYRMNQAFEMLISYLAVGCPLTSCRPRLLPLLPFQERLVPGQTREMCLHEMSWLLCNLHVLHWQTLQWIRWSVFFSLLTFSSTKLPTCAEAWDAAPCAVFPASLTASLTASPPFFTWGTAAPSIILIAQLVYAAPMTHWQWAPELPSTCFRDSVASLPALPAQIGKCVLSVLRLWFVHCVSGKSSSSLLFFLGCKGQRTWIIFSQYLFYKPAPERSWVWLGSWVLKDAYETRKPCSCKASGMR